jgi:hypothetical protein
MPSLPQTTKYRLREYLDKVHTEFENISNLLSLLEEVQEYHGSRRDPSVSVFRQTERLKEFIPQL